MVSELPPRYTYGTWPHISTILCANLCRFLCYRHRCTTTSTSERAPVFSTTPDRVDELGKTSVLSACPAYLWDYFRYRLHCNPSGNIFGNTCNVPALRLSSTDTWYLVSYLVPVGFMSSETCIFCRRCYAYLCFYFRN